MEAGALRTGEYWRMVLKPAAVICLEELGFGLALHCIWGAEYKVNPWWAWEPEVLRGRFLLHFLQHEAQQHHP